MTIDKTKHTLPLLSSSQAPFPKMLQSNIVYKIKNVLDASRAMFGRPSDFLQHHLREHIGNKGFVKSHFELSNMKMSFLFFR